MKGVLICGGTGSRLRPLTEITNKSLLPIYDRPLIQYPLQTLLDGGIRDIVVISGNEHIDQMAGFLGSGSRFGCRLTYRVQDKPQGIAQALGMAAEFAEGENICAILGDNVYFDDVREKISSFTTGAQVFVKSVHDAARFGVAEVDATGTVTSIEEKPTAPKSDLAVTGLYLYDKRCFEIIRNLQPSARGEYEITDLNKWYMDRGELKATVLMQDWVDAGTFESLHRASTLVRAQRLAAIDAAKNASIEKVTTDAQKKPAMQL